MSTVDIEPNYNACYKHQDAEVYGLYGQRGCDDCVHTASLFAAQRTHLKAELLAKMPKKLTGPNDAAGQLFDTAYYRTKLAEYMGIKE